MYDYEAKTKTPISYAFILQLLLAFVFVNAKSRFSHEAAQIDNMYI